MAAAQRGYPENAEDPTVAPPDYDIRQSGRVLKLQNSDHLVTTDRHVLAPSHPHDHS